MSLKGQVLLLNANYEALRVVSVERAIQLVLRDENPGRIERPVEGEFIHSSSGFEIPKPSVLVLTHYKNIRENIRKSNIERLKVFTRYGFKCGYCGKKGSQSTLTLDHVFPKSRGGQDTPENLAAACKVCNNKKADRTPEEAKMPLLINPKPLNLSVSRIMAHAWVEKHPEWADYLFMGDGDSRMQHRGE